MQISLFQILLSVINLQFTEKILQYIASVNIIINPNWPVFVIFTIIHIFSDVWCLLPVIAVIMFLHHQPDHRQIADIQRFCPWPSRIFLHFLKETDHLIKQESADFTTWSDFQLKLCQTCPRFCINLCRNLPDFSTGALHNICCSDIIHQIKFHSAVWINVAAIPYNNNS